MSNGDGNMTLSEIGPTFKFFEKMIQIKSFSKIQINQSENWTEGFI
jgi:hypothetical protein